MNCIKKFSRSSPELRMDSVLRNVEMKCRELAFLKTLVSYLFLPGTPGDERFYHHLVSLARKKAGSGPEIFSSLIREFVQFLEDQEKEGLAFYYSFYSREEGPFLEIRKNIKRKILMDLHRSPGALKALYVDDNYTHLRLMHKRVSAYKQFLDYFTTPEEALERIQRERPGYHLVISDYRIPGSMSGVEFLKKVRKVPTYENRVLVLYSSLPPDDQSIEEEGFFSLSKGDVEALAGLFHRALQLKESFFNLSF